MKYKTIYEAISKLNYTSYKNYANMVHDLWVIVELPKCNKRVWITHQFNKHFSITTCDLNVENAKQTHFNFKNLTAMKNFITTELY